MHPSLDRRQLLLAGGALAASVACRNPKEDVPMPFEPTRESLQAHRAPAWFKDAKFGVFIHWGPYSVPAFAPGSDAGEVGSPMDGFRLNPYAEWYLNTMQFEDSPTAEFHRSSYGEGASYDDFGAAFNESLVGWNPDEWARVFKKSGARYVVLVTKHHDGFLLWPSATPNPHKPNWGTTRDVVGELAEAVRAQGLRFGVYYSGGIDWTFKHQRIASLQDLFVNIPGEADGYPAYANAHYDELIRRYRPDYLWNDIGYSSDADAFRVIASYYNAVPEGLTNDRWMTPDGPPSPEASARPEGVEGLIPPEPPVWDVRTPEYGKISQLLPFDWEATRGLGRSFGYNRNETEGDLLDGGEIVAMLAGSAAYGGNVLLNTGPRGDAQLDPPQVERLLQVGEWLQANGRYVQDTRAVALATREVGGVQVGAVENDDELIVHLIGTPAEQSVEIALPAGTGHGAPSLLGGGDADAVLQDGQLVVSPVQWPRSPIQTVVIPRASRG